MRSTALPDVSKGRNRHHMSRGWRRHRSVGRAIACLAVAAASVCAALAPVASAARTQPPAGAQAPQGTAADALRVTGREIVGDITTLASAPFEGRRTGTPGNAKARALIVDRFRQLGLAPLTSDYQMPFEFSRNGTKERGINVVGLCKGSGAADDRVMAITAHYDHLGVRNGVMHPGADDNASGVAVMLAIARQCRARPWTHDALFVAFDAEEVGLQGARAFVAQPPIPKERIAININFDMVGRSDTRELYVAGTHHRPELRKPIEAAAARTPFTLRIGHDKPKDQSGGLDDWTMQSDHGAFHAAGIPFLYFGVEDHADYHKPSDTADKIELTFVAQIAVAVVDIVTTLDRALPVR